ncbi:MAG: hypothetical protein QNI84_07995 [Henriciella sp.]|nr:hypothetical protein [Henriciella sp.]
MTLRTVQIDPVSLARAIARYEEEALAEDPNFVQAKALREKATVGEHAAMMATALFPFLEAQVQQSE